MLELVNLCDWQPAAMGCLYTSVKFGAQSLIFCEWMGKKAYEIADTACSNEQTFFAVLSTLPGTKFFEKYSVILALYLYKYCHGSKH